MTLTKDDFGTNNGYLAYRGIPIHRWVAWQFLGRPFEPDEIVHHRDGNKLNAHPDNLEVISRYEHNTHIRSLGGHRLILLPPLDILEKLERATPKQIAYPGISSNDYPEPNVGVRIATSITAEMKAELEERAASNQRSLASLIRFILQRYLDHITIEETKRKEEL